MTEFMFRQVNLSTGEGCLFAMGIALLCGLVIAVVYRLGTDRPSKYMMITTLIMPAVVQSVIMLVNGKVGTGIAVAGAFSLVRFRSVPGSSRDICILFLSMASGIAAGIGYVGYGAVFTVAIALVILISEKLIPSENSKKARFLHIHIPEDMDYSELFDDIFAEYATVCTLNAVKTVRMGTMFDLQYTITLKDPKKEKEMIDKLRCRNGNLTISCGMVPVNRDEL